MKSTKGSLTGSLWGELPARETLKQEVITPDIIENIWRQVMDESSNSDCDYRVNGRSEYIQLPIGNLHVLNTINLHQQMRNLQSGVCSTTSIPMEIDGENTEEQKQVSNLFNFISPKRKITIKNFSSVQHLTPDTANNLLKHAVICLLAHIGFEKASDIALETLTDVADRFLRRMTLLLKVATQQKDHGFPDVVERVLCETGVGGVVALHDYYQEYVIRFEQKMKKKVEKMVEEQRELELRSCNTTLDLDEAASKLQFEELDEYGNVYREVPTLQLLDPEIGFTSSLDAGFQMLDSLEQDQLQGLDVGEDVNVNDSPNTGHIELTGEKRKK